MPTVSIILVNLNGAGLLPDCLASLNAQTYRDFETILVDNGSQDASVAVARTHMPDVKVIPLKENTGFAAGNNVGIRASVGRYVLLLNNDTVADERFLLELVRAVEQDARVGMVAPKILNFYERRVIDSVGGLVLSPDGIGQGRGRGEVDAGQYDGLREALLPSGCAALYRRELLDEVGLLAEDFFAYCEDADLGLRAVWAGWKAVAAPRAVVFHKYSATTSAYAPLKLFLVERNHYFLVLKNYPLVALALVPFWTLLRFGLMAYAAACGKGKGAAAAGGKVGALVVALLRAHGAALCGLASQLAHRPSLKRIGSGEFVARLRAHRLPLTRMILTN